MARPPAPRPPYLLLLLLSLPVALSAAAGAAVPELSSERVVLSTDHGDITLAFYPEVAPETCAHIYKLFALGLYDTNHIFRVDRGFVAQVADVVGGRAAKIHDAEYRKLAARTIKGEFSEVPHVRGTLSMGRFDDPNSATSSFSMLLGRAKHLDGTYAVFGEVVAGDAVLQALEALPTRREGIFVMPTERIEIRSTYIYGHGALHAAAFGSPAGSLGVESAKDCAEEADAAFQRGLSQGEDEEGRHAAARIAQGEQALENLAREVITSVGGERDVALLAKAAAGGGSSGGANALGRLVAAARTALGREHQAAAREHSAMRDALDEGRVAATRVGALCAVAGVIGGAMAARLWRQKPVAPQKQYV